MCGCHSVSLGFTDEKVPVGTHMCLIYTSEEERKESLTKFLLSGLQTGERMVCFSNKMDEDTLESFLADYGISFQEKKGAKAISFSGADEAYFKEGVFDPDRMLETLSAFYRESIDMGFPASRVIGEMTPEIEHVPGGERLLEYESRVSLLLRESPVTSVCQYDAAAFNGATIMDVLKVHPKMIVKGAVVNNPFYIKPEDYLSSLHE